MITIILFCLRFPCNNFSAFNESFAGAVCLSYILHKVAYIFNGIVNNIGLAFANFYCNVVFLCRTELLNDDKEGSSIIVILGEDGDDVGLNENTPIEPNN